MKAEREVEGRSQRAGVKGELNQVGVTCGLNNVWQAHSPGGRDGSSPHSTAGRKPHPAFVDRYENYLGHVRVKGIPLVKVAKSFDNSVVKLIGGREREAHGAGSPCGVAGGVKP
jgi:hypothetical protein